MIPRNRNELFEVNHLDKNSMLYKKNQQTENKQNLKISVFISDFQK